VPTPDVASPAFSRPPTPSKTSRGFTTQHITLTHLYPWSNATLSPLNAHNSPLYPLKYPETHTILHQPRESRFCLNFKKNPQKVNGISVSDTPKIGERPYPRQFHPVETTLFFGHFWIIYAHVVSITSYPHNLNLNPNPFTYPTPLLYQITDLTYTDATQTQLSQNIISHLSHSPTALYNTIHDPPKPRYGTCYHVNKQPNTTR